MSQTENIKKWLKSPAAHLTATNAGCSPLRAKAVCAALSDSILDDPLESALINAYRVALSGEQAIISDGEAPGVVLRREDHPSERTDSPMAVAEFHFCPMCGAPWEGGLHKAFCFGPPAARMDDARCSACRPSATCEEHTYDSGGIAEVQRAENEAKGPRTDSAPTDLVNENRALRAEVARLIKQTNQYREERADRLDAALAAQRAVNQGTNEIPAPTPFLGLASMLGTVEAPPSVVARQARFAADRAETGSQVVEAMARANEPVPSVNLAEAWEPYTDEHTGELLYRRRLRTDSPLPDVLNTIIDETIAGLSPGLSALESLQKIKKLAYDAMQRSEPTLPSVFAAAKTVVHWRERQRSGDGIPPGQLYMSIDTLAKALDALPSGVQDSESPLSGVSEPHASMTREQLVNELDRYAANHNALDRKLDAYKRALELIEAELYKHAPDVDVGPILDQADDETGVFLFPKEAIQTLSEGISRRLDGGKAVVVWKDGQVREILLDPSVGSNGSADTVICIKCHNPWPGGMCAGCVNDLLQTVINKTP